MHDPVYGLPRTLLLRAWVNNPLSGSRRTCVTSIMAAGKGWPRRVSGTGRSSVMAEEENKTIARRFNDEVWDKGDEAALEELFAEDAVDHGAIPGQPPGREGHKHQLALFRSAFPDLRVTSEDIFSEG